MLFELIDMRCVRGSDILSLTNLLISYYIEKK